MRKRFGRHFVADDRDSKYKIRRTATERAYRYWYDNSWWGDQLATPHCVGFAWTHWLTNVPVVNYLDPDGVYTLAQRFDEWKGSNYDGTSVRAGAKVLKMLGLIKRYEWCWDVNVLTNAVLERGPVVVGTNWYRGMEVPDRNGLISVTGKLLGGHAYLITGVNLHREAFRIKNSWGRKWGLDGRAYVSFDDMDKLIQAQGEVCLAVENKAKPPKVTESRCRTYEPRGNPTVFTAAEKRRRTAIRKVRGGRHK